jgi:hypothetical protein
MNPFISNMPHLLDLGKDKNDKNIYLNMSAVSHVIDTGVVLHVFMLANQADRYGQLQPLMLDGQVRLNFLNFVEEMDVEATDPKNFDASLNPIT